MLGTIYCSIGLFTFFATISLATKLPCKYHDDAHSMTFDITALQRAFNVPHIYSVDDASEQSQEKRNDTFVFNLCAPVATDLSQSGLPSQCTALDNGIAAAYQIEAKQENHVSWNVVGCYGLGGATKEDVNFHPIDEAYPDRGFTLEYTGGSQDGGCKLDRSLAINFRCNSKHGFNPAQQNALVIEYDQCRYSLTVDTIYGCPLECIGTGDEICSGRGTCAYNADEKKTQCLCDDGYGGENCDMGVKTGSSMSAEGIILIIASILLAGVLGMVIHMFIKLRRLQVDPTAYDNLEGRFNELGQMA